MEGFYAKELTAVGCFMKKRRSDTPRRPHPNSLHIPYCYNLFPDKHNTLSACEEYSKGDRLSPDFSAFKDISGSTSNSESCNRDASALLNKNTLKKVKLKFSGVSHTNHVISTVDIANSGGSSAAKFPHLHDALWSEQIQDNVKSGGFFPAKKSIALQGISRKDFSRSGSGSGITTETSLCEPVRKSKRIPKRRVLDVEFSNSDEDEELRYLGKLSASITANYETEEGESNKDHKNLKVSEISQQRDLTRVSNMEINESTMMGNDIRKKPKLEKTYEDEGYVEEEELTSDDGPEAFRKTLKRESNDLFMERKGMTLITRKQGIHSITEDVLNDSHRSPPMKGKQKLSEVEQQLKKVEAAQRRRLQSEKAAREAEAEAIRKILCQDSSKKKRDKKMRQQQLEEAQGKGATSVTFGSKTIRWVIGPTGTTVTFSDDIGLPNIFNLVPCRYPPPREKCVGPNCTNSYKYRDSKLKLPLCSLHCYRAMHNLWHLTSC